MKLPRRFFQPLAIGAPEPLRALPVRLERMIHFVPPHVEKMRAKVPDLIRQVDVVLGNLEDAIPIDAKLEARRGFIEMAKANEFGETGLWIRMNALNSPWGLDDLTEIVGAIGDKLDAKITNIDKASRRVVLSVKARELDEEKKAMADFGSSDSGASLGDILGAALKKKAEDDGK